MPRREEDATHIRLINRDLDTLMEATRLLKTALGDRFQCTGQPREGQRGDCMAFGLIMPAKDPEQSPTDPKEPK
jgi:hypothetical protein